MQAWIGKHQTICLKSLALAPKHHHLPASRALKATGQTRDAVAFGNRLGHIPPGAARAPRKTVTTKTSSVVWLPVVRFCASPRPPEGKHLFESLPDGPLGPKADLFGPKSCCRAVGPTPLGPTQTEDPLCIVPQAPVCFTWPAQARAMPRPPVRHTQEPHSVRNPGGLGE